MKLLVKITNSCDDSKKLGFVEHYYQTSGMPMAVVYSIDDHEITTCQLRYLIALGYISLDEYARVGLSGLKKIFRKTKQIKQI